MVGTILVLINHGDLLLSRELTWNAGWKIALTYLVPFAVATWSTLAASRLPSAVENGGRGSGRSR